MLMLCYNSPHCGAQIEFAMTVTRREGATGTKGLGRSPSKKASPNLDRMVPSWFFEAPAPIPFPAPLLLLACDEDACCSDNF
jgi:hypothetical protein